MSLKEKLITLLFGHKAETEPNGDTGAEQLFAAEETAGPPADDHVDPALLELPREHPIYRLYDLRRQESGYLPAPHVSLDEDGVLSPEAVQRELGRLRTGLTSVCSARLKEVKNGGSGKKGKGGGKRGKKGEQREEPEQEGPLALDALPYFFLSADKLFAWVMVLPPVGAGKELNRELFLQTMLGQSISYGVDERLVNRLPHDKHRYFHLFLIARGKPAFDGQNGNIVDYFPRTVERVFEADEFGQVDYTNLNLIHNVKQGQEICRLIKPTEGEPGRTVLDQEIPAKSGKTVPLPKGRNTEISEDGTLLLASMAGHVEFSGRSFQVKPVLDIQGDVDFSTGDIKFLGDVNIQGDVLSGFAVQAMGNVHVGGVVEAGGTVEAGGDLVVVKGILGDGTTVVRSHRSIFSKYIENATIYARESLQTDCIVNGSVYCDGEVRVRSGRGCIMGGRIWAAKMVNATAVGAPSECKTSISLGGLPCTNFERDIIRKELRELEADLEKLEGQLDSPAKSSILGKTRMKLSVAELKLKQLEEELVNIKVSLEEKDGGRMECSIAYPGTEVSFGEEILKMRHETRQCIVKMVCGEIVVM